MDCKMWFGTLQRPTWIDVPMSGADSSASSWGESGTYLNGLGFAMNSQGSHRRYVYSWGAANSRQAARLMQSYFEGTFGSGKIYFHDPLTYDTNVLPSRWANPSLTANFEGPQLAPGCDPTIGEAVANAASRDLPATTAIFDLTQASALGTSTEENSLFIPIPDGMRLHLGAVYSSSVGTAGVYFRRATLTGGQTSATLLAPLDAASSSLFSHAVTKAAGEAGVWLRIGKTATGAATVTISAIHARLSSMATTPPGDPNWIGGQGNAGCRFAGPPTYISHNGVDGGQIEYAATLVESVI